MPPCPHKPGLWCSASNDIRRTTPCPGCTVIGLNIGKLTQPQRNPLAQPLALAHWTNVAQPPSATPRGLGVALRSVPPCR